MTEIDFDILLAFTLLAVPEDIGPERQDIVAYGWALQCQPVYNSETAV
jgi:hypothetical protein